MSLDDLEACLDDYGDRPLWEWEPGHAGRCILEGLDSEDREVRLKAARLTWGIMDDNVAELLLEKAQHEPDPEICGHYLICFGPSLQEAVENQGLFEDDNTLGPEMLVRVRDVLRSFYHDPQQADDVRRKALETAVRGEPEWVTNAVRAAYSSSDQDWICTSIFCMGYLPGFHQEILESLDSDSHPIRHQAVLAAGEAVLEEGAGRLQAIVQDHTEDIDTRGEAMLALARVAPNEGRTRRLFQKLANGSDEDLRDYALLAIDEASVHAAMDAQFEGLDDFDEDL